MDKPTTRKRPSNPNQPHPAKPASSKVIELSEEFRQGRIQGYLLMSAHLDTLAVRLGRKPFPVLATQDDALDWAGNLADAAHRALDVPAPSTQKKDLKFGEALEALKRGAHVGRAGWNGKGMWLCLIHPGSASHKGHPMQPCIGMKTANGEMQPGWLASQADMLANDWQITQE